MFSPAHPAPELMKLCQAEALRVFHHHHCGIGHIDAHLAIILYGDLQVSVIDELPANRLPIKNCVVGTSYRPKAYQFIEKEVRAGRQAYVICPMVEEGEMEDLENVSEYAQKLRAALPADMQVATLHGKMKAADKNQVMEEYAAHNIDVLVSTTVIEVGSR